MALGPRSSHPPMKHSTESLGIVPIINAAGSVAHLSASPIAADIAEAMAAAAQSSVDIADSQCHASAIIAEHTGAEAGIVTSGASAGLLLGAPACLAGIDASAPWTGSATPPACATHFSCRAATAIPTITQCAPPADVLSKRESPIESSASA